MLVVVVVVLLIVLDNFLLAFLLYFDSLQSLLIINAFLLYLHFCRSVSQSISLSVSVSVYDWCLSVGQFISTLAGVVYLSIY